MMMKKGAFAQVVAALAVAAAPPLLLLPECVSAAVVVKQQTGYLMDHQCLNLCKDVPKGTPCAPDGINVYYEVARHTGWCLMLKKCVESGYVLLSPEVDSETEKHEIVLEFASTEANQTAYEYIRAGTSGPFPLVVVEYEEEEQEEETVAMYRNGVDQQGPIIQATTGVRIFDPWDAAVTDVDHYSGADTHQVECPNADSPNVLTNNLCFRSDVVVTTSTNDGYYVIESNGCPNHVSMQGSAGVINNTQPDYYHQHTMSTTATDNGGPCNGCCGSCNGCCGGGCCGGGNSSSIIPKNIDIEWKVQVYERQSANVGDTVTFTYAPFHTVARHANATCDEEGSLELANATASPYVYTFQPNDVGEVTFACQIPGHCPAGQIITFDVVSSSDDDDDKSSKPGKCCGGSCGGACGGTCGACGGNCGAGCGASTGCGAGCGANTECGAGCGATGRRDMQCGASCGACCGATGCGASCGACCGASCGAGGCGGKTCDAGCGGCCGAACCGGCGGAACCGGCCGAACCGGCCGSSSDKVGNGHGSGSITPFYQHYTMKIPRDPGSPGDPKYFVGDDVVGILSNGIILDSHQPTWSYDSCVGHSDPKHQYHYHIPPYCFLRSMGLPVPNSPNWWISDDGSEVRQYSEMPNQFPETATTSPVIGFARDGFPIFAPYDESGSLVTASMLDECNGMVDSTGNFGYYLTPDPPFAPPCLRGNKGVFSYHTTNLTCPSEGIETAFFTQSDVLANCDSPAFGDAPVCALGNSGASRLLASASAVAALVALLYM